MAPDRHLSPIETARRFGVSIKALRLYDQRGLLAPIRSPSGSTGSGWRTYGPDQIARLHQILALKRLGLPLARIAELLAGPDRLESILALQEQTLTQDAERLTRALKLVRSARSKLASGQALSIDDLTNLTKETVMVPITEDRKALFKQAFAARFTQEERDNILFKRTQLMEDWNNLKPELLAAIEAGDPTSVAAKDAAQRCRKLGQEMLGSNEELRSRFKAFRDDIDTDPNLSGILEFTQTMRDFVRKALAAK